MQILLLKLTFGKMKRSVIEDPKYKWHLPIKYKIENDVYKNDILNSIISLELDTCLRFTQTNEQIYEGLNFIYDVSCSSIVGKSRKNKPQNISIGSDCNTKGGIQHEILHALGILHTMSRKDRDKYLKILKKNISPDALTNFMIFNSIKTKDYKIKFDYGSGMLYDRLAGSKNFKPSTLAKYKYYSKTMGQLHELAFTDIKLVNMHYCNDICEKKLYCQNHGYTNPNNCDVCKCPRFFSGRFCDKMWKSPPKCGKLIFRTRLRLKKLIISGEKKCLFKIYSPYHKKIKLNIEYTNLIAMDPCQHNNGLEIKYLNDKSVSGAMFCGIYRNADITTSSREIYIYYVGFEKNHTATLSFKNVNNRRKIKKV